MACTVRRLAVTFSPLVRRRAWHRRRIGRPRTAGSPPGRRTSARTRSAPARLQDFAHAPVEGFGLGIGEGIVEREHRHAMRDRFERRRRLAADALRGESARAARGAPTRSRRARGTARRTRRPESSVHRARSSGDRARRSGAAAPPHGRATAAAAKPSPRACAVTAPGEALQAAKSLSAAGCRARCCSAAARRRHPPPVRDGASPASFSSRPLSSTSSPPTVCAMRLPRASSGRRRGGSTTRGTSSRNTTPLVAPARRLSAVNASSVTFCSVTAPRPCRPAPTRSDRSATA